MSTMPPGAPPQRPEPPQRPRVPRGVLITVGVLGALVLISHFGSPESPAQTAAPSVPAPQAPLGQPADGGDGHQVLFEVTTADGTVGSVNWSTLEDSALLRDERSPFSKAVLLRSRTGLVGVLASDASRLRCRITVDGVVVDEGESDYTVNCSYTIN